MVFINPLHPLILDEVGAIHELPLLGYPQTPSRESPAPLFQHSKYARLCRAVKVIKARNDAPVA